MTSFAFLEDEWPEIFEVATTAENRAFVDPRAACFYARRALQLSMRWMYTADETLRLPYQESLSALIHEPTFKAVVGEAVWAKARLVAQLGSQALHGRRQLRDDDALVALEESFHFAYWFARNYARRGQPSASVAFSGPRPSPPPGHQMTVDELRRADTNFATQDVPLLPLLTEGAALSDELVRLRREVARARRAAAAAPDTHNYSEAETRDYFIDLLLKEAGWPLLEQRDREYPVKGMPNKLGDGFVDYVLWGDDGLPLAVVEAKRTTKSAEIGQQQAKLYADCLEAEFGRRPLIFYTNGYDHWFWDDLEYAPRSVQGFLKKDELELAIWRRDNRKPLASAEISTTIVERYYQTRAIRRIAEAFEQERERKALVVMATGAGKTRTVIALCDLLMRRNWVKRVLFLADRVALVNQAVGAFKTHLPDAAPVNLVTDREGDGRVFVSTYPTMMGLINDLQEGKRRFGVGHFDLVVIDEAHRSVYQKYGAIFDYFDSHLVGLTATPKDEIDINTYRLFDLERGVPTDSYTLDDAVKDGFLVPPRAVSVPVKFHRAGINYDELSDEEKDLWDTLEWDDDGATPDRVEADAINRWLFNEDTVDKVLAHLMTRGQRVASGDRPGKTIIFAKNQAHAEFIVERFDVNYPHFKGAFARVIHHGVPYVQTLIDDFSAPEKAPHIAVSVDMLDTGIDIPEIVNLVFLKPVRSKTKFWQMVGRGTRLRKDLFGPGHDKGFFYIFDYCQNLEFFSQDVETVDGRLSDSLGARLFKMRLALLGLLDEQQTKDTEESYPLRDDVASTLHREVAAMNLDNFIVRPKRAIVQKFTDAAAWATVTEKGRRQLARDVAGLPSELDPEAEEARRFDLLMLTLQLGVLQAGSPPERLRNQLQVIASELEEKSTIPVVQRQLELIEAVQTDEWWEDVTVEMLELVRKRLRDLVMFIDRHQRAILYTDFEDELGPDQEVDLFRNVKVDTFATFCAKARAFLRDHETHLAIHKLRMNKPLTPTDIEELERMLVSSGVGGPDDLQRATQDAAGLGLFVRSLVGLDREAAKEAFADFLDGKTMTGNQIEFVNLIVDHLTDHGVMIPALLYEPPFTDVAPRGPEGLFTEEEVVDLIAVLDDVRAAALVA